MDDPRRKAMISLKEKGHTYDDIGKKFGLTRQRVQQIVNGKPKRGDRCDLCGSIKNLHSHHTSYEGEKTITLCSSCHTKEHSKERKKERGNTLNEKEQEIWEYLLGYAADFDNGHNEYESPTYREISEHLGMGRQGVQLVRYHLKNMAEKGYITLGSDYKWRSIKIISI